MKILQVGTELFHVDGRTDRQTDITKLIVAFRNFAKAPESHNIRKYIEKNALIRIILL